MTKRKNAPWPPKFLVELWEVQEKMAQEMESLSSEEILTLHHERGEQILKEIEKIKRNGRVKRKETPAVTTEHVR